MSTDFYKTVSIFSAILQHLPVILENLQDLPWIFRNTTKKNRITRTNIKNQVPLDNLKIVKSIHRWTGFPLVGDPPHYPKNWPVPLIWSHCFAPKMLVFVIVMQFLAILPCNFTKSITLLGMFFTFFKLYKWCQIAQNVPNTWNFQHLHIL